MSSTDFLEKRRSDQRDKCDADQKVYRSLARKLAISGKLAGAEEGRLSGAMDALGIDFARFAADAKVFQRVAALEPVAACLPEHQAASAGIAAEGEQLADEYAGFSVPYNEKANALHVRNAVVAKAIRDAVKAKVELSEIRCQHFELLDAADPAAEAKRFHLIQIVASGTPKNTRHSVFTLEQVMSAPSAFRQLLCVNEGDLVPLDGQEDAAELLATAQAIIRGVKPGMYLISAADALSARECTNLLMYSDGAGRNDVNLYSPDSDGFSVMFIRFPNQSAEVLAERVEELRAKERKAHKKLASASRFD